ncbi:MAG: right-handed parallel beta-helix repeat-containing protein [Candidatus Krumholzibacteria bacterium]
MRRLTTSSFALIVLLTFASHHASAATWYVEPDGSGDAATIQAGIDAASPGDTVLLATGVFKGPGNTNVDFLGKGVTVTSASGPEFTIVDCDSAARGFLFQSGEDATSVLSRITILNGVHNFFGGAIFCRNASPTITGNILIENRSAIFQGGAIYCDSSSAIIHNNAFEGNFAASAGGGVWCSGNSTVTIEGNTFTGNTSTSGGGIGVDDSAPVIRGNRFVGNGATFGAAIHLSTGSTAVIDSNAFESNSSGSHGGAIRCQNSSPIIKRNTFTGNVAAVDGGAISCEDNSLPMIRNNTFDANNVAGAGAAIYCADFSDAKIWNNIIVNSSGVPVASANSSFPEIACCDFFGNSGGDNLPFDSRDGGGNFKADPMFCVPPDSGLLSISPCAPGNHPDGLDCGRIGAEGVGCFVVVGIDDLTPPVSYSLHQNYPNPFNPTTTIAFESARSGMVTLRVFDSAGKLVRTLVDGHRPAGRGLETWDGTNNSGNRVSSGVYFYQLKAPGYRQTRKMVFLK